MRNGGISGPRSAGFRFGAFIGGLVQLVALVALIAASWVLAGLLAHGVWVLVGWGWDLF